MKPNLRALSKTATNVLCALSVVASLLPVIGCGDVSEDGVEDTGTYVLVSVVAADDFGRNVDVAEDDENGDCVLDHNLSDTTVSVTFTSRSVVPDPPTVTTLRVESYTIDYSTDDPLGPSLESRVFPTDFVIEPNQTVTRADLLLVGLATVDEFSFAIGLDQRVENRADPDPTSEEGAEICEVVNYTSFLPADFPTEYTAHYTFHAVNVPFGESMTFTADVNFSFGFFHEPVK